MINPDIDQLAADAANKIHWANGAKPDAYTQEDIARTKTIVLEVIRKVQGDQRPYRAL